jgi:2-C-methyl-D-erythritol 4-phosphate cytidylyltransferase/2-C-methyl-D-erythritol 2,4-cyclodiphosphate synthase
MNGVVAAVVVAAGRGVRAGSQGPHQFPKQYRAIAGEPVIRASLKMLADHPGIAMVQPVIHRDDIALFQAASAGLELLTPVFGGATRQASVRARAGSAEARRPDLVPCADAARPFASAASSRAGSRPPAPAGAIPVLAIAGHGEDGRRIAAP